MGAPGEICLAAGQCEVMQEEDLRLTWENMTYYIRITAAKDSAVFEWVATAENGWHAMVVNDQVGWVSGKYSKAE